MNEGRTGQDWIAAFAAMLGVEAPDVSLEECFRLARAMTLKNAAAATLSITSMARRPVDGSCM